MVYNLTTEKVVSRLTADFVVLVKLASAGLCVSVVVQAPMLHVKAFESLDFCFYNPHL